MTASWPVPDAVLRVKPRDAKCNPGDVLELGSGSSTLLRSDRRSIIWRKTLRDGTDAAVKFYRRGFNSWLRSRVSGFRVRREFNGLSLLESLRIPCASPLFWCHGHFGAHGWGEILATRWVPDRRPLSEILGSDPAYGERMDLTPLFGDVGRLHDAGVRFGTLLSRNILVRTAAAEPAHVFIDMPRFHHFPRSIRRTRMAHYDLLYLCDSLAPGVPEQRVRHGLTAYGMPATDQHGFLAALKQFRNVPRMRRIIGAEFNARHALARMGSVFSLRG